MNKIMTSLLLNVHVAWDNGKKALIFHWFLLVIDVTGPLFTIINLSGLDAMCGIDPL